MNRRLVRKCGLISRSLPPLLTYIRPSWAYLFFYGPRSGFLTPSVFRDLALVLSRDLVTRRELTNRRFENNQSTGGIVENNVLSGAFAFGIVSHPSSLWFEVYELGSSYRSRFRHFE